MAFNHNHLQKSFVRNELRCTWYIRIVGSTFCSNFSRINLRYTHHYSKQYMFPNSRFLYVQTPSHPASAPFGRSLRSRVLRTSLCSEWTPDKVEMKSGIPTVNHFWSIWKKEFRFLETPLYMAGQEGFEPPTRWLTATCSADWATDQ